MAKNIVLAYGADIFESPCQTIVNPINCVGCMGGGLAAAFRKRYPAMNVQYEKDCAAGLVKVREPYIAWKAPDGHPDNLRRHGRWIMNFATKDHYKYPSRLEWVDEGLNYIGEHYANWGITSIAFPALGSGLGGLDWKVVLPVILGHVSLWDIPVYVYPPQ